MYLELQARVCKPTKSLCHKHPPSQVRLKLHIVARHMYLEVQLPGLTPRGGARGGFGGLGLGGRSAMPPRLSDKAKEVGCGGQRAVAAALLAVAWLASVGGLPVPLEARKAYNSVQPH